MIIHMSSISKLNKQFLNNPVGFADQLKEEIKQKTGQIVSAGEWQSWLQTLKNIIEKLNSEIKNDRQVLLEYLIPWTQGRIDLIVLGKSGEKKRILMIELKGWKTASIRTNGHINASTRYQVKHPSLEIRSYKRDIENFSDIQKLGYEIIPCVVMPNYDSNNKYKLWSSNFKKYNDGVVIFDQRNIAELAKYIDDIQLEDLNQDEINEIDRLKRIPFDPLMIQKDITKIQLSSSQENVLDDIVEEILHTPKNEKKLILVEGVPGSGKSLVAIRLMLELNQHKITSDIMIPGTEFRNSLKSKFNEYMWSDRMVGFGLKNKEWIRHHGSVMIFDEAHKMSKMGAQINQVLSTAFKNIDICVAFIDNHQVVGRVGATSDDYIKYVEKNKIPYCKFKLNDSFRNGGEIAFPYWLQNWIFNSKESNIEQKYFVSNGYKANIFTDEKKFIDNYLEKFHTSNSRLMTLWFLHPHFSLEFTKNNKLKKDISLGGKSFYWNISPQWIRRAKEVEGKSVPKSIIDLAKENFNNINYKQSMTIGYTDNVQGAEYDNSFVYIPKFVQWRNNELYFDVDQFLKNKNTKKYISGTYLHAENVKSDSLERQKEKEKQNRLFLKNRLYVLLTRGMKSVNIYCADKALSSHLKSLIK